MDALVCGIDPGLGITGYAVVRGRIGPGPGAGVIDAGVCRFESDPPLAERLAAIEGDITAVLAEHRPSVVAVEQLYSHYNHPRTAILMGHARGVILLAAAKLGIEVRSYSATRIKRFLTGNGRASKSQVQRAIETALGLPAPPEPPDVADALAIALCCANDVDQSVGGWRSEAKCGPRPASGRTARLRGQSARLGRFIGRGSDHGKAE